MTTAPFAFTVTYVTMDGFVREPGSLALFVLAACIAVCRLRRRSSSRA